MIATPYRTNLSQNGLNPVSLYSGDMGNQQLVTKLTTAAGGSSASSDSPLTPIPGRILEQATTDVLPNTVVVNPVTNATGAAASKLSLSGAVQWVKDNPGKAIAVGIGLYLVLNEVFGKKGK